MLGRQSEISFKADRASRICAECGCAVQRFHGYVLHNRLLCGKCADLALYPGGGVRGFNDTDQMRRAAE
jgi:ribosomal protein S27AE